MTQLQVRGSMNNRSYFLSIHTGRTSSYSHPCTDLTSLHLQTYSVKRHLTVRNVSLLIFHK